LVLHISAITFFGAGSSGPLSRCPDVKYNHPFQNPTSVVLTRYGSFPITDHACRHLWHKNTSYIIPSVVTEINLQRGEKKKRHGLMQLKKCDLDIHIVYCCDCNDMTKVCQILGQALTWQTSNGLLGDTSTWHGRSCHKPIVKMIRFLSLLDFGVHLNQY
jgi:hypothetical protein